MKRTLSTICIATLALAVAASGEELNQKRTGGGKPAKSAVTNSARTRGPSVQRSPHAGVRQNTSARTFNNRATVSNRARNDATINRSKMRTNSNMNTRRVTSHENMVRRNQVTANNRAVTRNNVANERMNRNQNIQRQRSVANHTNRNVNVNRTRNVNRNAKVVNNWRSDRFAGRNYAAFRNYHRNWHNRGYWRSHYDHIIFVSGGWYFWNAGYWYPAWGYDSGYSYPYDGPIYGSVSMSPGQIIVNVQQQLAAGGYYDGPIDGVLGPQTRYAIAAYQADHGLAVTSAVDEPTLANLGLS